MTTTYDIRIESLYEAYWECRRNKSRTHNASRFEADYEANLLNLHREIAAGIYSPGRSVAFIVDRPVKREIFAADFRDRIVHHWIALRIEPLLEEIFVDETFNCRKGKGNSAGIAHLHRTIREVSGNYAGDCWVMKLDLRSFFMSINRELLCGKLCRFIGEHYAGDDMGALLYLTKSILLNDPVKNCVIRGDRTRWAGLPANKSLFTNRPGYGLPIGNLTSQLCGNFLLNETDHYIRENLGLQMVRYVDDYCLVDGDTEKLLAAVPLIREHLRASAGVELHPKKFYLQHYSKGVKFIGAVVKRDRLYISNRTVDNAIRRLHHFNREALEPGYVEKSAEAFVSSMNSYLGIMKHCRSYNIRRRLVAMIAPEWFRAVSVSEDLTKLIVKKRYKRRNRIEYALKMQRKIIVRR